VFATSQGSERAVAKIERAVFDGESLRSEGGGADLTQEKIGGRDNGSGSLVAKRLEGA